MKAVFLRELQSYFYTAGAYVYMGVFLLLGSIFCAVNNVAARSGDVLSLLWMMGYLWMLLTPILTMRSFAGDRRQHTDQLLYTSPAPLTGIVLGKYLAACTVLMITVLLSLVYVLIIALWGRVYPGELLAGYTGFILQGCAFIAIDLYLSVRARSTMTAAVTAFGVNLGLWLIDVLNAAVTMAPLNAVLEFISPYQRCTPFRLGQMSYASVAYFAAVIFAMLFLCVRHLDMRRWRSV